MDKNSFPFIIFEASMAWRNELDKRLKPLGLSQAKWRVLTHLSLSSDAMTHMDLAHRLGVEGPTLVGMLDRLTKDNWIKRKEGFTDNQNNPIQLTPRALITLKTIHLTADALCEEILAIVPKEKIAVCTEVLTFVKTQLEAMK